jgi:hypothetical protein
MANFCRYTARGLEVPAPSQEAQPVQNNIKSVFQITLPSIHKRKDSLKQSHDATSTIFALQQSALKAASRELGLDCLPLPLRWKEARKPRLDVNPSKLESPSEPPLWQARNKELLGTRMGTLDGQGRAVHAIQEHCAGVVKGGGRKLSHAQMQANWDAL